MLWFFTKKYIIYPYAILIKFARKFDTKNNFLVYSLIIVFTEIVPKIIWHIALITDVIYLNSFYYSYKLITFLLIPLIMPVFLFILDDLHQKYFEHTDNMINIDQMTINGTKKTVISFKSPETKIDINYFVKYHFMVLANIPRMLTQYHNIKNKLYFNYINIFFAVLKLSLFFYTLYLLDFSFIFNKIIC